MTQITCDSTICHSLLTSFILPSIYIVITLLFTYISSIRRARRITLVNNTHLLDEIYQFLSSVSPVCSVKGWKCNGVQDGCRIWCFDHTNAHFLYGDTLHSISFLAHASVNNLLSVFLEPREILEWNYIFSFNCQVLVFLFSNYIAYCNLKYLF